MTVASPTEVPDLDDVIDITASSDSSCALRSSGEIVCWGEIAKGAAKITW